MQKKLTLNQTWKHCLAMWKWIAEQKSQGNDLDVSQLKWGWMEKHPRFAGVVCDCFFCKYDIEHGTGDCSNCPGKLVDKKFHCGNKTYDWSEKPIKFYQKLVELNEKRRSK